MKRGFGKQVDGNRRVVREMVYRIIAYHFSERLIDRRPKPGPLARPPEVAQRSRSLISEQGKISVSLLLTVLFSVMMTWSSVANAQDSTEQADITIVFPQEGEVLRSLDFAVEYALSGDLAGARLDHIHWQITGGFNNTAPDLSGIIDVSAPADGNYTLTLYMATPEHDVIHEKRHVQFRIATRGAVLLAPAQNALLRSSDVSVSYSMFGELPAGGALLIGLDGSERSDLSGDGSVLFRGVANGVHAATARIVNAEGETVGDSGTHYFQVRSPLLPQNARRAAGLLKQFERRGSKERRIVVSKTRALLLAMSRGGSRSPLDRHLTNQNVRRSLALLQRIEKKPSDRKSLRMLRTILTAMSTR